MYKQKKQLNLLNKTLKMARNSDFYRSKFVDSLIKLKDISDLKNTKFTRYTVNTSHSKIRQKEGWGGAWPSCFSGYKSWIEHFSDGYVVIDR